MAEPLERVVDEGGLRDIPGVGEAIAEIVTRLHADRTMSQRREALDGFRAGRYRVLVATDIAARGIDVPEIAHVVNFDLPHTAEDYIHRIGRTARAEATGHATSFATPEDREQLRAIERHLGHPVPRHGANGHDTRPFRSEQQERPALRKDE